MTLRAAVVGCGRIGSEFADDPRVPGVYTHAGAYAACEGVELAGVCDRDPAKARRCATRWRLPESFTDLDALLERARPDVVSVCTPDATHAAVLRRLLTADGVRAVFAEKPLAQSVPEAEALVRLAAERDIVLAVNYMRRYSPGHGRVHQLIRDGALGEVQKVSGFYTKGVLHNGSHWFDLARWLVGEVSAVHGFEGSGDAEDGDPSLDVRLEFEGGAGGFLHGCSAAAFSIFEMDIVGTRGRVRLFDSGHRIGVQTVGDSRYYSGYRSLLPESEQDGDLRDVLIHGVRDVLDCVTSSGSRPRCSGEDGLAALRIAGAAVASAASGTRIELNQLTATV